jgi:hypothetical protein
VAVFVHTTPFQPHHPHYSNQAFLALARQTHSLPALIALAWHSVTALNRPGYRYHRMGVKALGLRGAGRIVPGGARIGTATPVDGGD